MDKRVKLFLKSYPWYVGVTSDLLFYIAIDTLFLTKVNDFSAAEIVSLASLSQVICISLQFPVLFIIRKIGNTASLRSGALCLLLSALFITFGKEYYLVLVGRIFHDVSASFTSASVVALENNLDLVDRRSDFVHYRTSGIFFYSVITLLISFVASFMFNINPYLPMIACVATCTAGFILSLLMKDCSDYNKIRYKSKSGVKVKIQYNKLIILAIVLYAIFYSIVTNGQNEGKLFIQQNVLLDFDMEQTAFIIGAIVCASRMIRVISNMIFERLYKKYQEKMGVALPVALATSIGMLLFGSLLPGVIVKIIVMAIGYSIILFIRDPFKLYIQDVLFSILPKEQHQTILTVLSFGVKIATAGIGLAFSAILLCYPMIVVIAIMLAISTIEIMLGMILYKAILKAKAMKEAVDIIL